MYGRFWAKIAGVGAQRNLEVEGRSDLLGDVLYAGKAKPPVSEAEWVALVLSIAAGNQPALHALYERAHRPVFTLIMRIIANRETAEELTLDVFHDVWRRARPLRRGRRHRARMDHESSPLPRPRPAAVRAAARNACSPTRKILRPGPRRPTRDDLVAFQQQSVALRSALTALTPDERSSHRDGFLRRADACRSGGAAEPATRHGQDAHPLRDCTSSGWHWPRERTSDELNPRRQPLRPIGAGVRVCRCMRYQRARRPRVEAHLASCSHCRRELEALRPVVDGFVAWPTDVLRPSPSLQERLAHRIAAETGGEPVCRRRGNGSEPEWEEVAPGIFCKLLATDTGSAPRQHAGAAAARRRLSGPHACRGRGAAPARRRAVDRRPQAPPRRLQPGRAPARATSACGARPAAPACSSPARATSSPEDLLGIRKRLRQRGAAGQPSFS